MKSDDSGNITPADIEGKLKDFKVNSYLYQVAFPFCRRLGHQQ